MLQAYGNLRPQIDPAARVAETAVVVGEVSVEAGASLWYGAVLRGDEAPIRVGRDSNIQDNAVLHCDEDFPMTVGRRVTVGHGAIVHGCTIGDGSLVGMGAVVIDGARVGKHCLVGAGALVTGTADIPDGMLVIGSPARAVRPLTPDELTGLEESVQEYLHVGDELAEQGLLACEAQAG